LYDEVIKYLEEKKNEMFENVNNMYTSNNFVDLYVHIYFKENHIILNQLLDKFKFQAELLKQKRYLLDVSGYIIILCCFGKTNLF
jgi:hypothetical protein